MDILRLQYIERRILLINILATEHHDALVVNRRRAVIDSGQRLAHGCFVFNYRVNPMSNLKLPF